MANKNYINRLIDGDARSFDEIYFAYKSLFIAVMRKEYGHDMEHAVDLYHRAMAALDNNVRTGRIKRDGLPDEKLKAYIINTGKMISLNDYRKRQTPLAFNTDYVMNLDGAPGRKTRSDEVAEEPYDTEADERENVKLAIIRAVVDEMKNPCAELLELAIYRRKRNEEIAAIMNYANAQSVATQRNRCMEKLRGFAKKRFKESGYED